MTRSRFYASCVVPSAAEFFASKRRETSGAEVQLYNQSDAADIVGALPSASKAI
jgi:hypothetical protein